MVLMILELTRLFLPLDVHTSACYQTFRTCLVRFVLVSDFCGAMLDKERATVS